MYQDKAQAYHPWIIICYFSKKSITLSFTQNKSACHWGKKKISATQQSSNRYLVKYATTMIFCVFNKRSQNVYKHQRDDKHSDNIQRTS